LPHIGTEEDKLTGRIIDLASQYGRYGYRRITALLRGESWQVNHKKVERIWRKEGLKVPQKQPKRGRLWLNNGSCVRLRPEYKDHVWSYDFVIARTSDGRAFRLLTILDEYSRECLAIMVKRHITSQDVIDQLFELFIFREIPEHIRSDNGPEFTAKEVRDVCVLYTYDWPSGCLAKPNYVLYTLTTQSILGKNQTGGSDG
jgi:putative transposase